jgi:hypothetical protein
VELNDPPRQIFNAPSAKQNVYETNVGESGQYSIRIKCDNDCEWKVVIESDGTQVASSDTLRSETTKSDLSFNTDQLKQKKDETASESNPKILNTSIVKEEWDILSQSEAIVILAAPNTRAITLDYNSSSRKAVVTGAVNAVPANANVMVANLELGTYILTEASQR